MQILIISLDLPIISSFKKVSEWQEAMISKPSWECFFCIGLPVDWRSSSSPELGWLEIS